MTMTFWLNSMLPGYGYDSFDDEISIIHFLQCGHCKKLEPVYEELAAKISKSHEKLIIAKMDATANEIDVPGVEVKGFPTLYFFPGNDKKHPIRYEGEREIPGFVDFLGKYTHHSLRADEL